MHTSGTLSRLQNITDTPDNKDVIPMNFYSILHLTILSMHIHIWLKIFMYTKQNH